MNQIEFKRRTKQLGLAVIRMTEKFPETRLAWVVKDQILRSALSVGANYRAVCRAKSDKDFINKMRIVEEEADETAYWLWLWLLSGLKVSGLTKSSNHRIIKSQITE